MSGRKLSGWRGVLAWLALASVSVALQAHPVDSDVVTGRPALHLDIHTSRLELTPYVSVYHDPGGQDDLAAVRERLASGGFSPLPDNKTAFGFQPGAFWFHARLVNANLREPRWLLVQKYALSDYIEVHTLHADGHVDTHTGGDALPFEARSIRYRLPNFWINVPPGPPVDLLVRISSQSSMQVPLWLYTPGAFAEVSRDAQFGIGLYYGILLALFVYNLVLWLRLRDPSYFWYLLHISAFGLVLFTLNGLGFEYLWPKSPWLADKAVPLSICLAQVGMQQFARYFLELRQRWRLGDLVGLAMIAFFVAWGLASVWLPYRIATPVASAAVFVSIAWIAIESIVVTARGYKPARIFLLAWGLFLAGTGMFAALAFGVLPKTFLTEYGVQIGSATEMLLLSIALSYRYSALRQENERIIRAGREELAQEVEQRTSELRLALDQLGQAHARLRESSQRDGLTGLHTRAHFMERFQQLMVEAYRAEQPLSVLMIDLDHFKDINDQHGHLVGDECLRFSAHLLGQILRRYNAVVARFGGEEFVVGLPGKDGAQALQVAEELRRSLDESACDVAGIQIRLTASIGVHELQVDGGSQVANALQQADEALYRAKADGRNCVRWGGGLPTHAT
ncbi:GGDEF domain-containing protein [Lysobacter sp. H21R4]|uniref:sensor domain-containing diguanylate cyclase n=1 Tax=Lysobacter sp. H21R4 TaxID=2781021 RepID=UPI001888D192|nr:diguanylate cyclase [Lysobacter sp. H21R4]QOY63655.1 GGDEF domain-containing protein [Lysobacter sp. H21R4]